MKFRSFVNQATHHPDHVLGRWRDLSQFICQKVSLLTGVQRVSVWEFRDSGETLTSVWVYDAGKNEFSSGESLKMSDFPLYVKAIKENRTLVVDDVYTHESTKEFCSQYFPAYGITSMIDSAIFAGDQLIGVICLEHSGPQKAWSLDVQNFSGNLADLISNTYLINQTNESQQQLLMNSKLASIGEMSADLLHEVANPLQALDGMIQFCRIELENGNIENVKKHLDRAEKASKRVAVVFHSMRNLMSREDEQPVSCQLMDMIEDIDVVLGQKMRDNEVELRIGKQLSNVEIRCLRSGTSQVLLNLVGNAIDAVHDLKEKWIKIDYTFDGHDHHIVVIDSGNGIPQVLRGKLFEVLFSTKRNNRGTGIGLSLCRKLIEKQGGKLFLVENNLNTSFEVILPKAS